MLEFEHDPIHNQTSEKLHSLNIQGVIFDLDDTLIYTAELFSRFEKEYAEIVSASTGANPNAIIKRLKELSEEEYHIIGVSPRRWYAVVNRLSQELKDTGVVKNNVDILMKIYTAEPRVRAGAKTILQGLKSSGFKIGMVTHAGTDWTERKLTQTGLLSFFDAIEAVDPNGSKTKEHWRKGMELLEVESRNCLVVGDNLKGDIVPAHDLGAKTIWIPSPWSVYREGVVPEGIVQMDKLQDFYEAVQKLN